jgi:hypothetical protein
MRTLDIERLEREWRCMQVRPPLSHLPVPATLCASVHCPRVALALHLQGSSPSVLHAGISGYSATLDGTSRISQTIQSALCSISKSTLPCVAHEAANTGTPAHAILLQAPCVSFVLLHQMADGDARASDASQLPQQVERGSHPFLSLSYRPPGVTETELEAEVLGLASLSRPHSSRPGETSNGGGLSMNSPHSPAASDTQAEAAPQLLRPRCARSKDGGGKDDVRAAAAVLKERVGRLQGSKMLGSVIVEVAPTEAFMDAPALLCLLETAIALQSAVAAGDTAFSRCALGCFLSSCSPYEKVSALAGTS